MPKQDQSPLIEQFLDALWLERGLSEHTLSAYRTDLNQLELHLDKNGETLLTASASLLQGCIKQKHQKGMSPRSVARALSAWRRFYRYALREELLTEDPTALVDTPKQGRKLPDTLSEEDVDALLNAPDTETAEGFRDRAMLETLYASGLRVSELVGLQVDQINFNLGVIKTIGKGNKERLVPVGDEAQEWLSSYMKTARVDLLAAKGLSDALFVTRRGGGMTRQTFWHAIKKHACAAGIKKHVSPHTLRHAFATHMLNHGADLRVVQMLLGHANVSTTQIYTHVAKARLQALHQAHHPRG